MGTMDAKAVSERFSPGLRPPTQERSKASLERVLAAGAELLIERGYKGFTVADVARRAHATTGLIYARFAGKAALFEGVMIREMTRITEEENSGLQKLREADLPLGDRIEQAVRFLAAVSRREARLTLVFTERTWSESTLMEHVKRLRTAPRLLEQLLLDQIQDFAHPEPERAASMVFWMTNAAIEHRVHTNTWSYWDPSASDDWDEFVGELVCAMKAYIMAPTPVPQTLGIRGVSKIPM